MVAPNEVGPVLEVSQARLRGDGWLDREEGEGDEQAATKRPAMKTAKSPSRPLITFAPALPSSRQL